MATLKKIKYVTQAELAAIIAAGTQEENCEYRIKDATVTLTLTMADGTTKTLTLAGEEVAGG